MARPRDRGEVKTATINIRVTPTLKEKLEAHARIAGRKLSAECEERLLQSMTDTEARASQDTEELLCEIKRLIGEIEQATGNEWRKGVATWAAVAEMLATGPIMQRVPPYLTESDRRLDQCYRDLLAAKDERDRLKEMIGLLGIVSVQLMPTLDYILPDRNDLREKALDRLPEHQQENAERLIAKLEELDKRELELVEEINEIVEPYQEAILSGRALYPKPPMGIALSAALRRLSPPPRHGNALEGTLNALLGNPPPTPSSMMFGRPA